jgi:hypothetical protein
MRTTTTLMILQTVEEDDFPTRAPEPAPITTTAAELPESATHRIPTPMLPPALRRLAQWVRR